MAAASTTPNPSLTSLPGITGATTPSTFTATTTGPSYSVAAILTESDTTVTAFQVSGTTGLFLVDNTTLTYHGEPLTLSDGNVISAGFNGLKDSTTTANLAPITVNASSSSSIYTIETTNPSLSSTVSRLTGTHGTDRTTNTGAGGSGTTAPPTTSGGNGGTAGAPSSSSSSSSSSAGVAPTLGAGKAIALLGALAGMVAYGL